ASTQGITASAQRARGRFADSLRPLELARTRGGGRQSTCTRSIATRALLYYRNIQVEYMIPNTVAWECLGNSNVVCVACDQTDTGNPRMHAIHTGNVPYRNIRIIVAGQRRVICDSSA